MFTLPALTQSVSFMKKEEHSFYSLWKYIPRILIIYKSERKL